MSQAVIVHPKLAKASFERAIEPLLTSPVDFDKIGIKLISYSYPYLDVELHWKMYGINLWLRVDGTNFSYRPVGGWWINSKGDPLLPGSQQVPAGNGFHPTNQDGKPGCWFCFKGWREYHDHSSHQDTSWASIRRDPGYSVLQLVIQLNRDLNNPGVVRA